jgi:hypothetical protein
MAGDNSAVLEDTDFVGEDVDIEDATARGVRAPIDSEHLYRLIPSSRSN